VALVKPPRTLQIFPQHYWLSPVCSCAKSTPLSILSLDKVLGSVQKVAHRVLPSKVVKFSPAAARQTSGAAQWTHGPQAACLVA
jgi:hypothetical protein